MTRFDLMAYSGVIREYRPMTRRERRRYSRRVDHALRYVCPKDETFKALLETLFWLAVAGVAIAAAVAFPVMFVRWWMGA